MTTGNTRSSFQIKPGVLKLGEKQGSDKISKQSSLIAAKIKTKIANTSSFFKVSLKTNNKALALALEAQKLKSRQLEVETVRLRKEVEDLCFSLAVRRHKQNQLVSVLKQLQSSTLNNLAAALDLMSHEDEVLEILENDQQQPDSEATTLKFRGEEEKVAIPAAQLEGTEFPLQTRKGVQVLKVDDPVPHKEGEEAESMTSKVQPSSSLQLELNKWSKTHSEHVGEGGSDVADGVLNANGLCSAAVGHGELLLDSTQIKASAEASHQEKTTLFETEMDITLIDTSVHIDAVETRPKRSEVGLLKPVGKGKKKKNKQVKKNSSTCEETDCSAVRKTEPEHLLKASSTVRMCEDEDGPEQTEDGCGVSSLVTARRKTHVTSRNTKNHRHPHTSSKNADLSRTSTVPSDFALSCPFKDDYFEDPEVQSLTFRNKEIPWTENVQDDKTSYMDRQTSSAPRCYSAVNRKTYVVEKCTQVCLQTADGGSRAASLKDEESGHVACSPELTCALDPPQSGGGSYMLETQKSPQQEQWLSEKRKRKEMYPEEEKQSASKSRRVGELDGREDLTTNKRDSGKCPSNNIAATRRSRKTNNNGTSRSRKNLAQRDDTSNPGKENLNTFGHSESTLRQSYTGDLEVQSSTAARGGEEVHAENPVYLDKIINSIPTYCVADIRKTYIVCTGKRDNDDSVGSREGRGPSEITGVKMDCNPECCKKQGACECEKCEYQDSTTSAHCSAYEVQRLSAPASSVKADQHHTVDKGNGGSADQGTETLGESLRRFIEEESPPWEAADTSYLYCPQWNLLVESPVRRLKKSGQPRVAVYSDSVTSMPSDSTVVEENVLKSLTNTNRTSGVEPGRPRRGGGAVISYKDPPVNTKIRRGDPFTDTTFLSSPIYKEVRKKNRVKKP